MTLRSSCSIIHGSKIFIKGDNFIDLIDNWFLPIRLGFNEIKFLNYLFIFESELFSHRVQVLTIITQTWDTLQIHYTTWIYYTKVWKWSHLKIKIITLSIWKHPHTLITNNKIVTWKLKTQFQILNFVALLIKEILFFTNIREMTHTHTYMCVVYKFDKNFIYEFFK